ncbi:methyltransferase domain-containing protein [Sciscionella marina]|uniref:methyltransferase domain-containing protein n=1 Tax=Sciscionella marina TaxID=508770 RepID=UPI00035D2F91|nr:methyltransferase domain-containing protein [Sciscionella marina]
MTNPADPSTPKPWHHYARALANLLCDRGDLTDPAWYNAIAHTPRHRLVPQIWKQEGAPEWTPVDTAGPAGLELVYSPTSLITKVDARGVPISSSTKPDLMVRMLESLDVRGGDRVLEIGTGTGYNAALLTHRLGDDNVVSIDVDDELVETARARLARFGAHPILAIVDGENGFPARTPYDRIIATCSVSTVPWAWAEQVRDGGRILVSIMPTIHAGNLVLLEKHGDRLEGRFSRRLGQFMSMRHTGEAPETLASAQPAGDERQRTTTAPTEPWKISPVAWMWAALELPGLSLGYSLNDEGTVDASYLTTPDGSWATVPLGRGERTITEAGPTPIWYVIEKTLDRWHSTGQPGWERLGMTATPGRQTMWLDAPDGHHHWPLTGN